VARDEKKKLVEKAKEYKNLNDFSSATKKIIQLQKQWKTIKNSGRYERSLWEEFRKACDDFFNTKDEASKERIKSLRDNLKAKKEALIHFKNLDVDSETELISIKESISSFVALGAVSKNDIFKLVDEFSEAVKEKLTVMKIDDIQAELICYKFRIDSFALMDNRVDFFFKEKNALKKRLSSLENEVFQSENNMGYFSISKGAEKLFDQVNKKNDDIKKEISLIKRQLKIIPNE